MSCSNVEYLEKTRDDPPHSCKLVNNAEAAQIKLEYVHCVQIVAVETRISTSSLAKG
jgi:hypothetical protein